MSTKWQFGVRWDGLGADIYPDNVEIAGSLEEARMWLVAEETIPSSSMLSGTLVRRPFTPWEEVKV